MRIAPWVLIASIVLLISHSVFSDTSAACNASVTRPTLIFAEGQELIRYTDLLVKNINAKKLENCSELSVVMSDRCDGETALIYQYTSIGIFLANSEYRHNYEISVYPDRFETIGSIDKIKVSSTDFVFQSSRKTNFPFNATISQKIEVEMNDSTVEIQSEAWNSWTSFWPQTVKCVYL